MPAEAGIVLQFRSRGGRYRADTEALDFVDLPGLLKNEYESEHKIADTQNGLEHRNAGKM